MKAQHYYYLLFSVVLTMLVFPHMVLAASYCDRVRSGDLKDANLLLCEDFEAPTLHDNVNFGGGAPNYGPWYDDTGYAGNRGFNSYWSRHYGASVGVCAWGQRQPSNPTFGHACAYGTCAPGGYSVGNLWQANNFSCIDIVQNGEFNAEVSSIGNGPTLPDGRAGVFDGKQSLAHRIGPGRIAGIEGESAFPGGAQRNIGVTMAVAYAPNIVSSGITSAPWKHNEWGVPRDAIFLMFNESGITSNFPFLMDMYHNGQAACQNAINNATKTLGSFSCNDVAFYFRGDTSVYNQPRDWPLGTWGCVRGYYQNLGLSNGSIQVWFTGPSGVEKKVLDISNLDFRGMIHAAYGGYNSFVWNAYANANQWTNTTTQTTYRYEDNVHIRAGAPVSCAQIGFLSEATPPPPPLPPSSLNVQ